MNEHSTHAAPRIERDLLGERQIPADVLWGIHTARALENFELAGRPVHTSLIHAFGEVKLACAKANRELDTWDNVTADAIEDACAEMAEGKLDAHVVVDAYQGGAGTSTNMNVNEVLTNRALVKLGKQPGDYEVLDPIGDLNLHQSTNDTFPTALKVAAISLARDLEREMTALFESFQEKEKQFRHIVKVGRTQYQDAVLITLGREMGAYAEAFSRDRWRIYKCEERLRVVNLGGTAVGTGLTAPRKFIFRATEHLRSITGYGLARAENLIDATQNVDVYTEVSGILSACATNMLKIANDLRFLSSGPDAGIGELRLPALQAGSSIMPGKVNPVVPEAVTQAAMIVMSNHQIIALTAGMGHLELNPFLTIIADKLLESLSLLARICRMFREKCVDGLEANEERCHRHVETSVATLTALVERIGYHAAEDIARELGEKKTTIRDLVIEKGILTPEEYDELGSFESVTRLGSPDIPKGSAT